MISKIIYLYHKKNRYLQSYIQDLISEKTNFKPHMIKVEIASKENNSFEFNHFIFNYKKTRYDLLDNNLKVLS